MARKAKQPRGKRMNPIFFVFCEGMTEAAYIDFLRRNFRVPVEIIAKVSDSNISDTYIAKCKRDKFSTPADKTFLMFDIDVAGMLERLRKIKDVILLLSNPCIEYWFLLHYVDVNRELSTAECLALLKSKDAYYTKGFFSAGMQKIMVEGLENASLRAKRKEGYSNPSSSIHLLVDEILRFRNR